MCWLENCILMFFFVTGLWFSKILPIPEHWNCNKCCTQLNIEKCRFKCNISIFIEISIVVDWVGVFITFRVLMWLGSLSVCMWQYLVISWRHKLVYTLDQWKWPFTFKKVMRWCPFFIIFPLKRQKVDSSSILSRFLCRIVKLFQTRTLFIFTD